MRAAHAFGIFICSVVNYGHGVATSLDARAQDSAADGARVMTQIPRGAYAEGQKQSIRPSRAKCRDGDFKRQPYSAYIGHFAGQQMTAQVAGMARDRPRYFSPILSREFTHDG